MFDFQLCRFCLFRYLEQRSSSPVPGEKSDYLEVLNGFEVVGFTAQVNNCSDNMYLISL